MLLVSASATLTACGGGGSSADSDAAAVANRQKTGGKSSGSSSNSSSGSSSSTPTSTSVPFYGVNGHFVQGGIYSTNIPQQIADMKALGVSTIRQDAYSTADTASIAAVVNSFAPIQIEPSFNVYPTTTNETTAYNQFYAYGQTVAGQLAGKVPIIELMNEPENTYFKSGPAYSGVNVTDWATSNAQWPAFRGAVRGFYEGFRSVDTTKKTLIASPAIGWLHYGMLQGLWTGQAPDGTTGHPTARWDVVNYHWYYDFGDIQNAAGINVLAQMHTTFNLPILLSEVGVQTSVSSSAYNSYIASSVAEYAANAKAYNIIGINWYELYNFQVNGGVSMGLYSAQGVGYSGRAAALSTAIASNPAP